MKMLSMLLYHVMEANHPTQWSGLVEVSKWIPRHPETIREWLGQFLSNGHDFLEDMRGKHSRDHILDDEHLAEKARKWVCFCLPTFKKTYSCLTLGAMEAVTSGPSSHGVGGCYVALLCTVEC